MAPLKLIWQCMFAPRLLRIYGSRNNEGIYQANNLERWGDQVIHSLYMLMNFGLYSSPLLASVLYRKGYLVLDSLITMAKVLTGLGLTLAAAYCARGFGRAHNKVYTEFQATFDAAMQSLNEDTKRALAKYDFEFYAMPIDFNWSDIKSDESNERLYVSRPSARRSAVERFISLPCQIAAYLVAHTFGIRMIYPGSVSVLQYLMSPVLLEGRRKQIEGAQGKRNKLRTRDGNDIDTMFIDHRKKRENGDMLAICSEGNAGFYEVGIMVTPLEAGYSVLGWNHPGFGSSSGMPYPDQILNAMDVVMQFAIHRLNFPLENIILFGWSIGGYPTSWAAMNYPDVRGVILDASFDDILPLAIPRMPRTLEPLVRRTIRDHVNLNVHEQLAKYPGPVLLVRRTDDEIICTEEMNLSTNRGNDLLVKLLRYRYPKLITPDILRVMNEWLAVDNSGQRALWNQFKVNEDECQQILLSYVSEDSDAFPYLIGESLDFNTKVQITLFLCSKYMVDLPSTHCTPLPAPMFRTPWQLIYEPEFVQL